MVTIRDINHLSFIIKLFLQVCHLSFKFVYLLFKQINKIKTKCKGLPYLFFFQLLTRSLLKQFFFSTCFEARNAKIQNQFVKPGHLMGEIFYFIFKIGFIIYSKKYFSCLIFLSPLTSQIDALHRGDASIKACCRKASRVKV